MNDHHSEDREQHPHDDHQWKQNKENMLEIHLTRFLQEQAERIEFTPQMRTTIIQRLPARRKPGPRRFLAPAFALAATLLLVFSIAVYLLQNQQPVHQYTVTQTITAPAELANGGQLISLDPTEHHLVYQPANQPGLMYVADIKDPVTTNFLAMRYAHDVAWSPDGSELVTTVSPEGTPQPLLALVRVGQYMNPLGPDAQAASWSPTSAQQIIYVTQSDGQLQLWSITPTGHQAKSLRTMNVSLPVQHLLWTRDGQKLALIATNRTASSSTAQNQSASAIYVMDAHTSTLSEVVQPGTFTIGRVGWSPDKHYLTYEQADAQGHTTLHAKDINQQKELFTLDIQKKLVGWSWSPDNRALIYSDGGMLRTYTLHGIAIKLPKTDATQYYPFWLKDGRILYMHITNGIGQLVFLSQSSR
jgi:WD40 repeat protein